MNWSDLSLKDKSDLMKLYIKNGIYSLDEMRRDFNESSKKYDIGGPLKKLQLKQYNVLYPNREEILQQQAEQTQRQQDNIKPTKQEKAVMNTSSYRKSLEGDLKGMEEKLYLEEKEKTSNATKAVGRLLTSKGLFEVPGFKPMINGLLNKSKGRYVGYWASEEEEGLAYLDGYGVDDLFFMTVPSLEGWNLEGVHNLLPIYDDYIKERYPNELIRTYSVNTIEDDENSKPPYHFEPDTTINSHESFPPLDIKGNPVISSGNDKISYYMDDDGTVYKRVEDIYKYHPKDFRKTWGKTVNQKRGNSDLEKGLNHWTDIPLSIIDYNGHPIVYTTKWHPTETFLIGDDVLDKLYRNRNIRLNYEQSTKN